jgi:hypothetical protein
LFFRGNLPRLPKIFHERRVVGQVRPGGLPRKKYGHTRASNDTKQKGGEMGVPAATGEAEHCGG